MKDINLLPKSKVTLSIVLKIVLLVMLGITISSGGLFFGVIEPTLIALTLEREFDEHQSKMESFRTKEAELNALNAEFVLLEQRRQNMASLLEHKLPMSAVIAAIENLTNVDIVVSNFTYGTSIIGLQVRASSHIDIATFSQNLTNTEFFQSVRIMTIERDLTTAENVAMLSLTFR